jgi:hypothetical protein
MLMLVVVGIAAAGCAQRRLPTVEEASATVTERLNSAMGLSERELIRKIGVPTSSYVLADGSRVLEYEESDYLSSGVTITCKITVDVDETGTVSGWSYPAGSNLVMCGSITYGLR